MKCSGTSCGSWMPLLGKQDSSYLYNAFGNISGLKPSLEVCAGMAVVAVMYLPIILTMDMVCIVAFSLLAVYSNLMILESFILPGLNLIFFSSEFRGKLQLIRQMQVSERQEFCVSAGLTDVHSCTFPGAFEALLHTQADSVSCWIRLINFGLKTRILEQSIVYTY